VVGGNFVRRLRDSIAELNLVQRGGGRRSDAGDCECQSEEDTQALRDF
jgi:hypothetical protein